MLYYQVIFMVIVKYSNLSELPHKNNMNYLTFFSNNGIFIRSFSKFIIFNVNHYKKRHY